MPPPRLRKLRMLQYAKPAEGSGCRIGGDALRDKGAILQEGSLNLYLELRSAQSGAMKNNSENSTVGVGERDAEDQDRADLLHHPAVQEPDLTSLGDRTSTRLN